MAHTAQTCYVTQAELISLLPAAFVLEALDDDGDGVPDAAEAVCIMASNKVDSFLENRYLTPIPVATAPALVIAAAVHFAVGLCWKRRGKADSNPYKDDLASLEKQMTKIRDGQQDLDLTSRVPANQEPVQTVTMAAPAVSDRNRILF